MTSASYPSLSLSSHLSRQKENLKNLFHRNSTTIEIPLLRYTILSPINLSKRSLKTRNLLGKQFSNNSTAKEIVLTIEGLDVNNCTRIYAFRKFRSKNLGYNWSSDEIEYTNSVLVQKQKYKRINYFFSCRSAWTLALTNATIVDFHLEDCLGASLLN